MLRVFPLQELYSHIEKGLGKNLRARCSAPLLDSIEEYKAEMRGRHTIVMPYSGAEKTAIILPRYLFSYMHNNMPPNSRMIYYFPSPLFYVILYFLKLKHLFLNIYMVLLLTRNSSMKYNKISQRRITSCKNIQTIISSNFTHVFQIYFISHKHSLNI